MGFFSKEQCTFCDNKVGYLSRKKLVNNEGYICKECEKNCSSLINISHYTKKELERHIEYMKKQNRLFNEEFKSIEKKNKDSFMCISSGVEFSDELAMFTFISPEVNKKNYKELFRYDQIRKYEPYFIENPKGYKGKKYAEVGMLIRLKCLRSKYGDPNFTQKIVKDGDRSYNPYVHKMKVPISRDTDNKEDYKVLKEKLDQIFEKNKQSDVYSKIADRVEERVLGEDNLLAS